MKLDGLSRLTPHAVAIVAIAVLAVPFYSGCGERSKETAGTGPRTIKLAYIGLTCEAAMFVAEEKGFFKEQGIDVELVKTDWDGLRDGLGLGRFDVNYTLIMYLLKPIEQGLDVKIVGGIHKGCLRVHVPTDSDVQSIEQLKGKRIGIPTMGSPPFLFASRALAANGLDPRTDVEWIVVAPEVSGLALDNGQVDAIADSEPIGSILSEQGKVRAIVDQAADAEYRDEYCCAVVVSGAFARDDPESAAKVTRALLKGARWVEENPVAAATLSVEKKYVASSVDLNAHAISKLDYAPGVGDCRQSVSDAAIDMKAAGLLNESTDPAELAKRAWIDLDGVTDEWVEAIEVKSLAGQRPISDRLLVTLMLKEHAELCCGGGIAEEFAFSATGGR
jgi:NitT/TauT family transport system substrate-binding protein